MARSNATASRGSVAAARPSKARATENPKHTKDGSPDDDLRSAFAALGRMHYQVKRAGDLLDAAETVLRTEPSCRTAVHTIVVQSAEAIHLALEEPNHSNTAGAPDDMTDSLNGVEAMLFTLYGMICVARHLLSGDQEVKGDGKVSDPIADLLEAAATMAGLDETEGLCGDLTEIMSRLARHLPAAAQEARS